MACLDCTDVRGRIHQNVNTQPSRSQFVANLNNSANPELITGKTVRVGDFVFHSTTGTAVDGAGNKFAGLSNTNGVATATNKVPVNFWEANDNIHFMTYFEVAAPVAASLVVGNFYNFVAGDNSNKIDSTSGGAAASTKHVELLELGSDGCGTVAIFKKAIA